MSVETTETVRSVIRGFHIYSTTWTPVLQETLKCKRQSENVLDRYAVAVIKQNNGIVGRLPRKISILCSLFLRGGGSLRCQVAGSRQRSSDLPQGGLEIPCLITVKGKKRK